MDKKCVASVLRFIGYVDPTGISDIYGAVAKPPKCETRRLRFLH